MELITVADAGSELSPEAYEKLESGNVIFFPRMPIEFSEDDDRFLQAQRQTDARYHKNIAYRPKTDVLTGAAGGDSERLRRLMRSFSEQSVRVLARLLARYEKGWRLDYASFRPFEEAGRALSLHSRNDLLHFDAFPSRPTNGDRILRFFVNLNPEKPRVWLTTDAFPALAERFAQAAGLAKLARRALSPAAQIKRLFSLPGSNRSAYDEMMHRFHNFLKENREFQGSCPKQRWEFPPRSSWIVFTDMVSHAVLSGQMALEQTLIISWPSMLKPELAPAAVLERITGMAVTENAGGSRPSTSESKNLNA
jgi:3-deoxy-D-manno-oct-2-ulosonic acid (Kdo) hydroxylase